MAEPIKCVVSDILSKHEIALNVGHRDGVTVGMEFWILRNTQSKTTRVAKVTVHYVNHHESLATDIKKYIPISEIQVQDGARQILPLES